MTVGAMNSQNMTGQKAGDAVINSGAAGSSPVTGAASHPVDPVIINDPLIEGIDNTSGAKLSPSELLKQQLAAKVAGTGQFQTVVAVEDAPANSTGGAVNFDGQPHPLMTSVPGVISAPTPTPGVEHVVSLETQPFTRIPTIPQAREVLIQEPEMEVRIGPSARTFQHQIAGSTTITPGGKVIEFGGKVTGLGDNRFVGYGRYETSDPEEIAWLVSLCKMPASLTTEVVNQVVVPKKVDPTLRAAVVDAAKNTLLEADPNVAVFRENLGNVVRNPGTNTPNGDSTVTGNGAVRI